MPIDPQRRRELKQSVFKRHAYTPTAPKVLKFLNNLYNQAARNVLGPRDRASLQQFLYLNKGEPRGVRALNAVEELEEGHVRYYTVEKPPETSLVIKGLDSLN